MIHVAIIAAALTAAYLAGWVTGIRHAARQEQAHADRNDLW